MEDPKQKKVKTAVMRLDKAALYRICQISIALGCNYADAIDKIVGLIKDDVDLSQVDLSEYKSDRNHSCPARMSEESYQKISQLAENSSKPKSVTLSYIISQFPDSYIEFFQKGGDADVGE